LLPLRAAAAAASMEEALRQAAAASMEEEALLPVEASMEEALPWAGLLTWLGLPP
jgi:hypothetical protein